MKTRAATSLGTIGFMAAAVVFAGLAGVFLTQLLGNKYSRDPVRSVVVAAGSIEAGQPLRKEDLRVASWPASSVPEGTYGTVDDVVRAQRVPLIPLVRGEAILQSHLSRANAGIGIAPLLGKSERAMSIRTDDPVTLARLVYPGARVDLISTTRETTASGKPLVTAKTVIQNAKVLAVGEDIDPLSRARREKKKQQEQTEAGSAMGGAPGENADAREARGVVTLLVTPEQAEAVSLASREGKIDLVLRGPRDSTTVQTPGATFGGAVAAESGAASKGKGKAKGKGLSFDESDGLAVSTSDTPPRARRRAAAGRGRGIALAKAGAAPAGSAGGVIIFRGGK